MHRASRLTPPGQNLIEAYLSTLDTGRSYKLQGRQPIVSIQLNQEIRNRLISDFKAVSQIGAVDRTWERWLKGNDPYLRLTFDPAAADEDPSATFVTPTHPLARRTAKTSEPASTLACAIVRPSHRALRRVAIRSRSIGGKSWA